MSFTKFLEKIWATLDDLFSFLARAALFPPFAIIPGNKSQAVGRKSLFLRVQLAIQKSSTNISP